MNVTVYLALYVEVLYLYTRSLYKQMQYTDTGTFQYLIAYVSVSQRLYLFKNMILFLSRTV